MFLVALVCLFVRVCLFAHNITQKVMNGLRGNLWRGSG